MGRQIPTPTAARALTHRGAVADHPAQSVRVGHSALIALAVLLTLLVSSPPAAATSRTGTVDSIRQTLIRQHARVLFPYWLPNPLASWSHASLVEYPCGNVRCIRVDFGRSGSGSVIELVRESRTDLKLFLTPGGARTWRIVGHKRIHGNTIYVASDGSDREYVWYLGRYGYQVGSLNPKKAWQFVKALTPPGHEWIASLPNGGKLVVYATGPYASASRFTFDYTLGWSPDGDDYPDIEGYVPVPTSGTLSDSASYMDGFGNQITYMLAGALSWNASVIQGTFNATDRTGDSVNATWQAYRVG
jgi:hypothetical protein